jgi:hypothetical protein
VRLHADAPKTVSEIQLIFPVRGHSYLPADRVFGRAELQLKRESNVLTPEAYKEFYTRVGKVRCIGKEWPLLDIKNLGTRSAKTGMDK